MPARAERPRLTGRDWLLIALFPLNLLGQIIGWLMLEAARIFLRLACRILRI